ncbi:MAG: NAD-dependent epimerase/dehydratase family protein [Candidatus Pristimantibacillus sp.]
MTKVLVLGGTRFFGKKLVEQLIREGMDVTILTRGMASDPFGHSVKRLVADRSDKDALSKAVADSKYDLVYDNICYTAQEAKDAVELFTGRTSKYIVISSLSVYPFGGTAKKETEFDPYTYPITDSNLQKVDYAEGKRLVESVLFQQANFAVAAVRFPIVLGHDDYTRRLHFHVEHVQGDQPLGIPNPDAQMSFINSDEAATFLLWLGQSDLEGPVNACSDGQITPGQIIAYIAECSGKQAVVRNETELEHQSPFGIPEPWYMDTTKAEAAGFQFQPLNNWLPKLIQEIVG